MSFFAEVPEPEIPEPQEWAAPEWYQPSGDEIPVEVPLGVTLFADERLALTLQRAAIHSNGCNFTVQWHLRQRDETPAEWNANHQMFHSHTGTFAEMLRFGALYADGSRATTMGNFSPQDHETPPDGPMLRLNNMGGGGGMRRITMTGALWAWPLPPDGPVTLVVEWRAQGVPETHVELDAIAFRELAVSARPLWEDPLD